MAYTIDNYIKERGLSGADLDKFKAFLECEKVAGHKNKEVWADVYLDIAYKGGSTTHSTLEFAMVLLSKLDYMCVERETTYNAHFLPYLGFKAELVEGGAIIYDKKTPIFFVKYKKSDSVRCWEFDHESFDLFEIVKL